MCPDCRDSPLAIASVATPTEVNPTTSTPWGEVPRNICNVKMNEITSLKTTIHLLTNCILIISHSSSMNCSSILLHLQKLVPNDVNFRRRDLELRAVHHTLMRGG